MITVESWAADPRLAADFGLSPGEGVVHLERVLLAGGERVGLESSYLPKERVPELLGEFDPSSSLNAFLQE